MTQLGEGGHCEHVSHQDIKCEICDTLRKFNNDQKQRQDSIDADKRRELISHDKWRKARNKRKQARKK